MTHRHHTPLERLGDLSIKPLTGIPIALGVIYCTFLVIRFIGENLIGYVFEPLFEGMWLPLMTKLSLTLGEGSFLHNVFIGNLIGGEIDFTQRDSISSTSL